MRGATEKIGSNVFFVTDTPGRPARHIQAGSVRLAFRVWNAAPGARPRPGQPGSPAAILLPGPGEDAADWEPLALELASSWRVHAPDLRGPGDSERSGPDTAEQLADDLEAFIDALGLHRVALVGHSAGAVAAGLLAARHPDRVIRLVLEEPVLPFPREALGAIKAPALLIAGGPESHIDQDRLAEIASLLPDCELVTIPAGHQVHASAPEKFSAAVTAFLAGDA